MEETIDAEIRNIAAAKGQGALDKLISCEANPDIVFLDLNIPLMNGRQFLKEISKHANFSAIPIIMSKSSDKETISETLELGASELSPSLIVILTGKGF